MSLRGASAAARAVGQAAFRVAGKTSWTSQLSQSVRSDPYFSSSGSDTRVRRDVMAGKTGKGAASAAGKTLQSKNSPPAAKRAAASDLAQVGNDKRTGRQAASDAGKTLG